MVTRNWYLIDATDAVLGRLSTRAADLLRGKGKVEFAPHKDIGDFVVIANAGKVKLTGKKLEQKIDFRHSGYPQGDKYTLYKDLIVKNPEKMVRLSVSGMLPKNRLRAKALKRLRIYRNAAAVLEAKCQTIKIK
jgi:large subunit ribosomal protein L13